MTDLTTAVDPDAVFVGIDGLTVVYVPARRELFELTPIASQFVAAVRNDDRLDVPVGLVDDLTVQLRGIGVLSASGSPAARPGGATPAAEQERGRTTGRPPGAVPVVDDVLGPYAALDHHFTVAVDDPGLAGELARVLEDLRLDAAAGPETFRYVVAPTREGPVAWAGGERLDAHLSPAGVLATLLWDINRRAVASSGRHLVLHAGAVAADDGIAVVLPAAMEAGKTTLVTALVRAGMAYLSDELAALPDPFDTVLAYPKALSLDPGAWPLFPALAPGADQQALSPNQWLITADQVRSGACHAGSARLGLLVFPRHVPGVMTESRALRPVEALRLLAECAFGFRDQPGRVLPALARIAESVPAHRLTVGNGVDEATGAVTELVARATVRGQAADRNSVG